VENEEREVQEEWYKRGLLFLLVFFLLLFLSPTGPSSLLAHLKCLL